MDPKKPGSRAPAEPAGSVKQKPADSAPKVVGMGMQFVGDGGTQSSKHPAKSQPKTMRYLR
jgi:hypothetical protein